MKPTLLTALLFLSLLLPATAQKNTKSVLFSGTITNANIDTIALVYTIDNSIHKIGISKTGEFKTSLNLNQGYYNLSFQNEYTSMYLKPGYDIKIVCDLSQLDNSVAYSGKGAIENNYLASKNNLDEDLFLSNPELEEAALSEEAFLKKTNSIYELRKKHLSETKELDDHFKFLEQNNIALERRSELFNYPLMIRYQMGKPDFKESAIYPDPFKDLDLNNEKFLEIPVYAQVVLNYIFTINNQKMMAGNKNDMAVEFMNTIDSLIKNPKVKEFMAANAGKQLVEHTKSPDQFYQKFSSMVKDEQLRKPVEDIYNATQAIQKGKPSPDFNFADMVGKFFSLKDFKGKYVYIDVWATWCGPCKVEIPHLKKLESELHDKDIAFVSICTFDEQSKWESFVKTQQLSGTQLFAPRDNAFTKMYNIQGIPRFLLIDKEGNIIDSNAKRPSDPTLKDDLLGLP